MKNIIIVTLIIFLFAGCSEQQANDKPQLPIVTQKQELHTAVTSGAAVQSERGN